jgi:predicted nucleic acid-binding protein
MTVRFLADTSAISRLQQAKVHARWHRAVAQGVVGFSDPVELEVLRWVEGGERRRAMQETLRTSYPWIPTPDDIWADAKALQDRLGDRGLHNGASPVDLIVAITAERQRLTVLHDDRDFDVISGITGVRVQRITA